MCGTRPYFHSRSFKSMPANKKSGVHYAPAFFGLVESMGERKEPLLQVSFKLT
jgi:hypothetical protein